MGVCNLSQETKKKFLINILFYFSIALIIYIICRFLLQYLLPFVFASIIAWSVQGLSYRLEGKFGINRKISAPALAFLLYLFLLALIGVAIYGLITSTSGFLKDLPELFGKVSVYFESFQNEIFSKFNGMSYEMEATAEKLYKNTLNSTFTEIADVISGFATSFAKNLPSLMISSIVTAVASCYIARDFSALVRFFQSMLSKEVCKNIYKVKLILSESIFKFVKGYAILMLLTYIELCIGLLLLRVKYAPIISLIIAFIDILPVLGTGTVLVPWAIIELAFKNNRLGVGIIIIYIFITVVRNFSEPKIIGKQLGINPLFTLLTMFIGIRLFGLIGMVVMPVTFIVVVKYYKNEIEQESKDDF